LGQPALEDYRQQTSEGYSEAEYVKLTAQVRVLDGKEDAAVRAQIAGIENGTNPAIYTHILKEIAEKRVSLQAQLEQMEERRSQAAFIHPQEDAAALQAVMADVREALHAPELTPAEKHALIAQVVENIVPEETGCRITLRTPFQLGDRINSSDTVNLGVSVTHMDVQARRRQNMHRAGVDEIGHQIGRQVRAMPDQNAAQHGGLRRRHR